MQNKRENKQPLQKILLLQLQAYYDFMRTNGTNVSYHSVAR